MARAALADAKAELVALLDVGIAGVNIVLDHLPERTRLPGGTTVCVYTVGISPEFWLLAVAVFKNVTTDMRDAQNALDELLPAIDAATVDDGGYGPSDWTIDYPTGDPPSVIVATNIYQVGREDI